MRIPIKDYQEIVKIAWTKKSMEKMVQFLEGLNFRFLSAEYVHQSTGIDTNKDFQYLTRYHYISPKDPKKDRIDFNIMFAINAQLKQKQVYIWLIRKRYKKGNKVWDKPFDVNFKPKKLGTKYPDWMSIQDRIDFRRIEKKLVNRGLTDQEANFYNKCAPAVKEINKGRLE